MEFSQVCFTIEVIFFSKMFVNMSILLLFSYFKSGDLMTATDISILIRSPSYKFSVLFRCHLVIRDASVFYAYHRF